MRSLAFTILCPTSTGVPYQIGFHIKRVRCGSTVLTIATSGSRNVEEVIERRFSGRSQVFQNFAMIMMVHLTLVFFCHGTK